MGFDALSGKVSDLIAAGVMEIGDGYRAKNSELSDEGLPFARAANINDGFKFGGADCFPVDRVSSVGKKVSRAGDVVFTSKGTVGRFAFVTADVPQFVYSPQLCYWRSLDHQRLNPRYLYFWMQSQEFLHQIGYLKNQTDMADYVSLKDQREITLTIPDSDVQHSIADFLGAIESRIDILRQTNTTLEAIAQALFKSWFVDFDPVHAKVEGREPEAMDAATTALFPSEFEQSERGLIPKGWRTASFDEVATRSKDTVNPLHKPDTQFEHYSLPAFDTGQLPIQEQGGAIKSNKTLVPPDAVLVSKLNPHIPRIWAVGQVGANAVCSTEFLVWMPKAPATSAFVYCLASSRSFNSAMRQLVTGTSNSHQRVKPAQLGGIRVCAVSDRAMEAFASATGPLLQKILDNRQQAATLASLRDTLLPRLISGKLHLPEATEVAEVTPA